MGKKLHKGGKLAGGGEKKAIPRVRKKKFYGGREAVRLPIEPFIHQTSGDFQEVSAICRML